MDVSQHCHTYSWSQHTQGPPEEVRALAPCMQEVNLAEGRTTILTQMPMCTRHSGLDPNTATHAWDASIQRGHQKSSGSGAMHATSGKRHEEDAKTGTHAT